MLFTPTTLKDAWIIDLEKRGDARGFFARTMCQKEFAAHGLVTTYVQQNTSFSADKGTHPSTSRRSIWRNRSRTCSPACAA